MPTSKSPAKRHALDRINEAEIAQACGTLKCRKKLGRNIGFAFVHLDEPESRSCLLEAGRRGASRRSHRRLRHFEWPHF